MCVQMCVSLGGGVGGCVYVCVQEGDPPQQQTLLESSVSLSLSSVSGNGDVQGLRPVPSLPPSLPPSSLFFSFVLPIPLSFFPLLNPSSLWLPHLLIQQTDKNEAGALPSHTNMRKYLSKVLWLTPQALLMSRKTNLCSFRRFFKTLFETSSFRNCLVVN